MASTLSRNPAGTMLIIVLSVFLFFDLLVVGLRLWARRIKKKKLALNDWAIILSLVRTKSATFEKLDLWLTGDIRSSCSRFTLRSS